MKKIKITCKCGAKFKIPRKGQKACPSCGLVYTSTERELTWHMPEEKHEQISKDQD